MDYLYGTLPEVVDPFAYSGNSLDGTINIRIDNNKRVITTSVIKTPGELTILQNPEIFEKDTHFNGSSNALVQIPDYKIEALSTDDGETRALYVLKLYNFTTQQYETVGDTIYFQELLDNINIENGSIDESVDSKKSAVGNGGITSVLYKHTQSSTKVPTQIAFNGDGYSIISPNNIGVDIIGQKLNSVVSGGTMTGIQSIAFGGQAFGISGIRVVDLYYSGNHYYYNIIREKPLQIKYADNNISLVCNELTNSNIINFLIPDINGGKFPLDVRGTFTVTHDVDGSVINISPTTNDQQISVNIISGFTSIPTAKGNLAVSIGGGTKADFDWSQAFGLGTTTSSYGQMSVGTFNEDVLDALFVVGNGYYDYTNGEVVRSNAFAIKRTGEILIYNEGSLDSLVTHSQLESKVSDINARIDEVSEEVSSVDGQISEINVNLQLLSESIGGVNSTLSDLDGKIDGVDTKVDNLSTETSGKFTSIDGKLTEIESSIGAVSKECENHYSELKDTSNTLSSRILSIEELKLPDLIAQVKKYIDDKYGELETSTFLSVNEIYKKSVGYTDLKINELDNKFYLLGKDLKSLIDVNAVDITSLTERVELIEPALTTVQGNISILTDDINDVNKILGDSFTFDEETRTYIIDDGELL